MLPDPRRQFKTVHSGHHHIEQSQRIAMLGVDRSSQFSQGFRPIRHCRRLHAPVAQHLHQDVPVRLVVVHHQHRQIL